MSLWVSQLPVKCGAICSWITECMKWWGVRLHTLLWSEHCEFKGPGSSTEPANEATDSPHHLTDCWFIHDPILVEEVNLWLWGYCRLHMSCLRCKQKTTPRGDFYSQLSMRCGKQQRAGAGEMLVLLFPLTAASLTLQRMAGTVGRRGYQPLPKSPEIACQGQRDSSTIRFHGHTNQMWNAAPPLSCVIAPPPHAVNLCAFSHLRCGKKRGKKERHHYAGFTAAFQAWGDHHLSP